MPYFFIMIEISKADTKNNIIVVNARVNNLKNLSVSIPRKKFVVITGLSGSGKSSLAFDTLYADGQRRYVESLSSYARQFLGRMDKPDVDAILGIAPAIAIEQKVKTKNPRSTVGTSTEVYEYLKLLYARIGKTFSPLSGKQVKRHTVTDVVNYILSLPENTEVLLFSPLKLTPGRTIEQQFQVLLQQGFSRILIQDKIERIENLLQKEECKDNCFLIIDRLIINKEDVDFKARVADSVQTAFYEGHGILKLQVKDTKKPENIEFSNKFELDGITFEEPSVNLFTFNNPYGACKRCEGFGNIIGIDENKVVPNPRLSVFEGAIACWKGEKMGEWKEKLIRNAYKFDFPIHKPYFELTPQQKEILWEGNKYFEGINDFFKSLEEQAYKIQYRVMLSRYRGKTICPECHGTRLRKDANYVKIAGKSISDLVEMQLDALLNFFQTLKLPAHDMEIANRLLIEIKQRLQFLNDVGLGYLTLNRSSSTLSGGESQRINLATSLGSSLVGSMYILDEPSIGLHPRDTQRLIKVLKNLRNIGNTVIVVEHDEDIIKIADKIIDIGPESGEHGGEIVFEGSYKELISNNISYTALYLTGRKNISLPAFRRKWNNSIHIKNAFMHNISNVSVKFPLNVLTVVTGVSGSGKSTLVRDILYSSLKQEINGESNGEIIHATISGETNRIKAVEYIDQNPIGRSSRSNPATYLKAFDDIRQLFSRQPLSKMRGYKPGYFSFNIPGGRCEQCEGEGVIKVEMQFMADIYLKCDACNGKRFKEEVLEITYKNKSISDILDLTVDEAVEFFSQESHSLENRIVEKIKPLQDTGLGYLKLGQSSSTLSGGEAQRIKLAYFLSKGAGVNSTLFIFDEPTTGLHIHDISKLLKSFNALIENGHSIIVIEHNMEIIKSADWVIDMGPEGGNKGGNILFEGTPENLIHCNNNYTAMYLKNKIL